MQDCLFCKIAAKEISANVIYEDGATLAFLDINPCAPGHTVVIPKTHIETVLGLPDADAGPLLAAVREVARLLTNALKPDGFTIGINHGKHAGQTIEHLHIHVIPRWQGDGGGSVHGVVHNRGTESLDAILEKIRKVS